MLVIRYHTEKNKPGLYTIVGFEVYPKSVVDETCPGSSKDYENLAINRQKNAKGVVPKLRIPYTYSIYWREDNSIDHANRWALYYENESNKRSEGIHWVSFFNSIALLLLLTLVVVIIEFKVFKSETKDVDNKYKSLRSEVTKSPPRPLLLSVVVSSGLQLIIASVGVILLIIIKSQFDYNKARGTEFNNYQGAFSSFALTCFVLSGIIPSFFGIIFYKIFNNDNLNTQYPASKNYFLSVLFSGFLPSLVLSVMLFLNFFVFAKDSSTALPFGTIVVLLILFFLIVLPLGLIGGFYGNKFKLRNKSFFSKERTLSDAEPISPLQPSPSHSLGHKRTGVEFLRNTFIVMIVYGLIPFGIVYVELSFIFNSIWLEKTTFYYMYGFLFLTTITLIIIVAQSTVIGLFISLVIDHNPHWQWFSFRIGSSIGLYIFIYSFYYFFTHLNIRDFVSVLLYFGYMALVSVLVGIACGSVAVISGLRFVKKAYGSNKVD
jgi:transmembrane 9 superfamily protein 2/4